MSFPTNFFRKGNINLFLGNPGVGKTHGVVYLGHNSLDYDFNVIANICMFRKKNIPQAKKEGWLKKNVDYLEIPDRFKFVPLASEMIIEASKGDNNIIIVDEGNITASSSRATGHTAVQMKFLGFSIRKIGGCLVVIAQDETQLVPTLRANIVTYKVNIIEQDNHRRDFEFLKARKVFNNEKGINEVIFKHHATYIDIPQVNLPYDTIHPGGFIFDINLEVLYNQIARLSYENKWDSIDIRKHMEDIVEDMVEEYKIKSFLKEQHFVRTGTVAQYFGVTDDTIRNWSNEGKLKCSSIDQKGHRLFAINDVKNLKKIMKKQNPKKFGCVSR